MEIKLYQRYVLCLLMFTGLITNYMMRINISIALVDMVATSGNDTGTALCNTTSGGDEFGGGSLEWSGTDTSWVLTSFFIGYTLFQVSWASDLCLMSLSRFSGEDWQKRMELRRFSVFLILGWQS